MHGQQRIIIGCIILILINYKPTRMGAIEMETISIENRFLEQKRKRLFTHYTSPEAAQSIIENSKLRFTNCMFMNDTEEYISVFEILEHTEYYNNKEIASFIDRFRNDVTKQNEEICTWFPGRGPILGEYYVLSGSLNNDLLPLWNYYVKNDNYYGYAITLDVFELEKILKKQNGIMIYGPVIYDSQDQCQIIEKNVQRLFDEFEKTEKTDYDIDELQDNFFDFIQKIRLFFKKNDFEHEKEYRIVIFSQLEEFGGYKRHYFVKKGVICPYIEIEIPSLPIEEIKMSTSIEDGIGTMGIKQLLKNKGYNDNIEVSKSNIKIRF